MRTSVRGHISAAVNKRSLELDLIHSSSRNRNVEIAPEGGAMQPRDFMVRPVGIEPTTLSLEG
jgi:hypothetical protein